MPSETQVQQVLLDASLFKHHNCFRDVENTLIHGYKAKDKNFKMEYGTAFHKFAQEYRTSGDTTKAVLIALAHYNAPDIQSGIPPEDFRNSSHLFNTCMSYAKEYPRLTDRIQPAKNNSDGLPLLEARFKIPYLKRGNIEVLLCGTIDMIGFDYNEPVLLDYKTTSSWNIYEYLEGYELSPQLMMYKFIVEKLATELYPETFGLFKNVGCVIDGVFIRKPTDKNPSPVSFKRSEVIQFEDEKMDEFKLSLDRFIFGLVTLLEQNKPWPRNFTCCDQGYKSEGNSSGGCIFRKSCKAGDYLTGVEYLERDFVKVKYDPGTFQM